MQCPALFSDGGTLNSVHLDYMYTVQYTCACYISSGSHYNTFDHSVIRGLHFPMFQVRNIVEYNANVFVTCLYMNLLQNNVLHTISMNYRVQAWEMPCSGETGHYSVCKPHSPSSPPKKSRTLSDPKFPFIIPSVLPAVICEIIPLTTCQVHGHWYNLALEISFRTWWNGDQMSYWFHLEILNIIAAEGPQAWQQLLELELDYSF